MSIRIVQLGTPRASGEGIRLGTVRRPPRGVAKRDYSRLNYYDLWLPELAPSAQLLKWARFKPLTGRRWDTFARRYRTEMSRAPASHILELLAGLSAEVNLSVGCFCDDERYCHRSVLRELLVQAGADLA
jgi:uncharacterized protein YeaO (DUF488 family)